MFRLYSVSHPQDLYSNLNRKTGEVLQLMRSLVAYTIVIIWLINICAGLYLGIYFYSFYIIIIIIMHKGMERVKLFKKYCVCFLFCG
jgi:hypothetical protein